MTRFLKDIVVLTARDEARHVSFGIISLQHEIPKLPEEERAKLEDFALTALNVLLGRTGDARLPGTQRWIRAAADRRRP